MKTCEDIRRSSGKNNIYLKRKLFLRLEDNGAAQHIVVEEDRIDTAVGDSLELAGRNALGHEEVVHDLGALLGQGLVALGATSLLVSVASDHERSVNTLDLVSIDLQASLVLLGEDGLVDVEEDSGGSRDLLVDELLDLLDDLLLE